MPRNICGQQYAWQAGRAIALRSIAHSFTSMSAAELCIEERRIGRIEPRLDADMYYTVSVSSWRPECAPYCTAAYIMVSSFQENRSGADPIHPLLPNKQRS